MNHRICNPARLTLRLLAVLVACTVLAACETTPSPLAQSIPAQPAQAARHNLEQGHYSRAAELYAAAARQPAEAGTRSTLHLQSALAALQARRTDLAKRELTAVDPAQLEASNRQRYELVQKLLPMATLPPEQQLEQLPAPTNATPPAIAAYIWKTRARLLFEQYKYVAGIHNLVQRGAWLTDRQAIKSNNELVFKRALDAVELGRDSSTPAAGKADITTLGWLRLAEIRKRGPQQEPALQQALAQWENRFPGHPATRSVLTTVFGYEPRSTPQYNARPGTRLGAGPIMLALPLSGELAAPAQAIRAGFQMAHANSSSTRRIEVVDTTDLDAGDIIQQARTRGAALLVGPLVKSKVEALARLAPRMPVLALNQIHGIPAPPSFHRYALAPEDDARTAAQYAVALGWHNALVLIPNGPWGNRVLQAFRDAFTNQGGTIVDYASFDTHRVNHKEAVQSVLKSYRSGSAVDFVFMVAQPVHARLLRSQLRFYRGARLPVIATSDVYDGHPAPRKDGDLDGVSFTAIPWTLSSKPRIQAAREQALQTGTTATRRFPRLLAMGMDAWRLTERWSDEGLTAGTTLHGTTGVLEITASGRVRRHLAWAQFINGHATLLLPAALEVPSNLSQETLRQAAAARAAASAPTPVTTEPAATAIQNAAPATEDKRQRAAEIAPLIDMAEPDYGPVPTINTPADNALPTSGNGSIYPETPKRSIESIKPLIN